MLAYHNDAAGKAVILAPLQAHRDADQIIQGVYWENGKGCAVGCTIHSGKHAEYEPRFGIPAYAYAAAYAAYSARQRHFVAQADKLVLLLEAA